MLASLFSSRPSKTQLLDTLAGQRQMISLMEKEMLVAANAFDRDITNGVKTFIDAGNTVTSDCGTMKATRAIKDDGALVWLVLQNGIARAHHSAERDPFAAMDEALNAWVAEKTETRQRSKLAALFDQSISIDPTPARAAA